MNRRYKIENCAYAHLKDKKEAETESLQNKCGKLELDIPNLKKSEDFLGKGIMKLKRKVEDVISLCNSMKSAIDMLMNRGRAWKYLIRIKRSRQNTTS